MYNKINRYSLYATLALAFLIQMVFLDRFKIGGAKPDIVYILVIFFATFFGPKVGLEAGFVSGLFKDVYSLDIFGINSILLSLIGLIVGIMSPKIFRESKLTQSFLVFTSCVIYMILHYFASLFVRKITYLSLQEYLFYLILPSSLYTALLSAIIFPFLINGYKLKETAEYL